MEKYSGKSLIDIAEEVLLERKEHTNMYELFDIACEKRGIDAEMKNGLIAQFYTDMISSAKFVYLGNNEWDLKDNQEITLWEKDGSFYKEYNKVEVPEEFINEPVIATTIKPAKKEEPAVTAEPVAAQPEVVETKVEAPKVEEVKVEKQETVEPEVPEVTEIIPEQALEFEEELFDDYDDDFDEDKYNEYMDTYEDQYDD